MANESVKLLASDGQPEIEIVIGQIQRGDFEIILFDKNDSNPILIGSNHNKNVQAFKFIVNRPINQLDGSLLMWDVIIGASTTGSQSWSITLLIKQNGKVVENGKIVNRGEFEIVTQMSDEVRLEVK